MWTRQYIILINIYLRHEKSVSEDIIKYIQYKLKHKALKSFGIQNGFGLNMNAIVMFLWRLDTINNLKYLIWRTGIHI